MKTYHFTNEKGQEVWGIDYVLNGRRHRKRIGIGKKGKRTAELSLKKIETQIYENRGGLEVKRGRAIQRPFICKNRRFSAILLTNQEPNRGVAQPG